MKTIGDRIRTAREAKGVSRATLARDAGIAVSTLSDLELGRSRTTTALHRIAARLGLTAAELETGRPPSGAAKAAVLSHEIAADYVRFPLLEGFAGMGRGDYMGDYPEIMNFIEVTREWAAQSLRGVPFDAVRVITGRGTSNRGLYNDGDPIFLDARVKQFMGDAVYCFRWNGLVYVKQVQMIGKNRARIVSANPEYRPVEAPLDELEIGAHALKAWTLKDL